VRFRFLSVFISFWLCHSPAFAFDLEDYATTYRSTRDAWIKAADEFEVAVIDYMNHRVAAIEMGIDPNDDDFLAAITNDNMSNTCETTETFGEAALAYGRLISMAAAYLTDHLAAVDDDLNNSLSTYRQGRDAAVIAFTDSFGDPFIPNVATGTAQQEDLKSQLIYFRGQVTTSAWEYSLAAPPYTAATAAYRAASSTYNSLLRSVNEQFIVRYADIKSGGGSSDPRLDLIAPLPNSLK